MSCSFYTEDNDVLIRLSCTAVHDITMLSATQCFTFMMQLQGVDD